MDVKVWDGTSRSQAITRHALSGQRIIITKLAAPVGSGLLGGIMVVRDVDRVVRRIVLLKHGLCSGVPTLARPRTQLSVCYWHDK